MSADAPVVLLMGPTASGKSAVALALAERLGGEIVSADSAQVYRGMDIGTAKPGTAERSRIAHHLIDIVEPETRYSAARFAAEASAAITAIVGRGRLPIVAGGTMLYFKALRDGLSALPPGDATVRASLDARAAVIGWPAMHAELAQVDPATAARLDPNDAQRVQRALEVWRLTGTPLSLLQGRRKGHPRMPGRPYAFALVPGDRARLHRAIAARFDAMLEAGLVEELAALRRGHRLRSELPSMRCVGYRQVWQYQDGMIDGSEMRLRALAATRQLAKRQFTWLRATDAVTLDPYQSTTEALATAIATTIA